MKNQNIINELNFCVFDLETTGGNHTSDKIIEIGLARVEKLQITEKKSFLIRPEIKIPDFIQRLTNIKQKDVEKSPLIEEVIDEILEFMGDRILVAHNSSFDVPFFNSVLKRLGRPELTNNTICTNLMTKYLIPDLMNSNLNYMSRIFNIPHNKAHRALDDTIATAQLLIKYLEIFQDKEISKVNHLYYPRNKFELDRANFKSKEDYSKFKEKIENLTCYALVTFKGENGIILSSLPVHDNTDTKNYIFDFFQNKEWQNVTIKLYGPFILSMIHLNQIYNKISGDEKLVIYERLQSELNLPQKNKRVTHDPENIMGNVQQDQEQIQGQSHKEHHFFITHHIVPDQYIIYPLQQLNPKQQMVFKYPAHKKKLLSFIKNKGGKLKNSKSHESKTSNMIEKTLQDYLMQELTKYQKEKISHFIFFSKSYAMNQQQKFLSEIDDFVQKSKNPYNFPYKHI